MIHLIDLNLNYGVYFSILDLGMPLYIGSHLVRKIIIHFRLILEFSMII